MADYIRELRGLVGHRPIIVSAGSVLVEDSRGRLLMERRADSKTWGYVGGAQELGETTEETAARELKEETGLIANRLELLGVFSGKELYHLYPNGDQVYCTDVVYVCKDYSGTLTPQESEVLELAFFPWDALPEDILPCERPAIRAWCAGKARERGR